MTSHAERSSVRGVTRIRAFVRRHGDPLLAASIVLAALAQLFSDSGHSRAQLAYGTLAIVGVGMALTVRRRYPLAPLALVLVGMVAEPWIGEPGGGEAMGIAVLVAIYTAAAHTDGWRMWVAGAMTFVSGFMAMATDPDGIYFGAILFFGIFAGTPWAIGRAIRHRRLRESQLEREKAEAEAAIVDERARIARELHDVVAHAISVIVLQARGGRKQLVSSPEQTREALDAIEVTASQALAEMRRLLGLLRESEGDVALAPQPTLARLDELVGQVRNAGLPVELEIEGTPRELAPGVDLSAYRIVQEALTNALKHAGPATARVAVRYGDEGVELEISDDGVGNGNGHGTGHGLVGIRERVAVFGGEVDAGARPLGGYAVQARLPYASER
jgi:signal transduction histidine kinase